MWELAIKDGALKVREPVDDLGTLRVQLNQKLLIQHFISVKQNISLQQKQLQKHSAELFFKTKIFITWSLLTKATEKSILFPELHVLQFHPMIPDNRKFHSIGTMDTLTLPFGIEHTCTCKVHFSNTYLLVFGIFLI